jgi:hypothetical protein
MGGVEPGTVVGDVYFAVTNVMSLLWAGVWLLLLAAFVLGLPAEPDAEERPVRVESLRASGS